MNSNMHGRGGGRGGGVSGGNGNGGGPQRRVDNTYMGYHQNQHIPLNNNNMNSNSNSNSNINMINNNNKPLLQPYKSPVMNSAQLNSGIRDPFGPPLSNSTNETSSSKPHEEILRKHTQDYTMKKSVQLAMQKANSTSYGFYVSKTSTNNNMIIPAIPRI